MFLEHMPGTCPARARRRFPLDNSVAHKTELLWHATDVFRYVLCSILLYAADCGDLGSFAEAVGHAVAPIPCRLTLFAEGRGEDPPTHSSISS